MRQTTTDDSPELIRLAASVDSFLNRTFENVHIEGPALEPTTLASLNMMPVCTHRSQADYFLLGLFLYNMGIRRVRYAAGDNLTDLPFVGRRFKQWGAFPVSRDRVRNRTYVRTLCEQVARMLAEGDNVVVFPEGGRSYKGHMMEMKNGLIGASLVAQWRHPTQHFAFFPVAISYERLPELLYFDMLQKGKQIRSANGHVFKRIIGNAYYFGADLIAFSKFMLANKFRKRYGEVYIDYGEPIAIESVADLKTTYNDRARDDFSALRPAMQKAGESLHEAFLGLYRLLPMHVLSAVLARRTHCTRAAAVRRTAKILSRLRKQKRNTKSLDSFTEEQIVQYGIRQLAAFGAVACRQSRISVRKPSFIHYHAASVM